MIAYKLFSKLTDLNAQSSKNIEAEREFNALADQVNWPFAASTEQLTEWAQLHKNR